MNLHLLTELCDTLGVVFFHFWPQNHMNLSSIFFAFIPVAKIKTEYTFSFPVATVSMKLRIFENICELF